MELKLLLNSVVEFLFHVLNEVVLVLFQILHFLLNFLNLLDQPALFLTLGPQLLPQLVLFDGILALDNLHVLLEFAIQLLQLPVNKDLVLLHLLQLVSRLLILLCQLGEKNLILVETIFLSV